MFHDILKQEVLTVGAEALSWAVLKWDFKIFLSTILFQQWTDCSDEAFELMDD